MAEGQEKIYFAPGEKQGPSGQAAQVETLSQKGYDVLLFTEDVDEFIPQTLMKYGENLCNVTTDDLGLETEEEEADQEKAESLKDAVLREGGTGRAGERGASVQQPGQLPCESGAGCRHELRDGEIHEAGEPGICLHPGRILELNAEHPVFQVMEAAVTADPEKAKDYAKLLYGQALLMADLPLEDPMAYSELVCKLMK